MASDHAKGAFVYAPSGNRLGRIERVYQLVFEQILGEKVSTNPVQEAGGA